MSTPHRATPEQWAILEEQSAPEYDNTILELRSRIEALEAAQNAPTTPEHRPGGLVERVAEALCRAQLDSPSWVPEARAAIREVAAWFRRGDAGAGSAWTVAADVLDAVLKQEANQ